MVDWCEGPITCLELELLASVLLVMRHAMPCSTSEQSQAISIFILRLDRGITLLRFS